MPLSMTRPQRIERANRATRTFARQHLVVDTVPERHCTKIIRCRDCNLPFCTGSQLVGDVWNLGGDIRRHTFQVRRANNLKPDELDALNALATARLDIGTRIVMHRVCCRSCNSFAGYKVIGQDGDTEIVAVGQYILNGRISSVP